MKIQVREREREREKEKEMRECLLITGERGER